MSIKLHHGPPGSYKTSGAVQDDFIRWVYEGKTVVTNVRGLNDREQIINVLETKSRSPFAKQKHVPSSFELIYIDTSFQAGRDKLAKFWHWAPHGASFLIDEIQAIYPMDWVKSDFRKLDYPGTPDEAQQANRPYNYAIAFEMHRHYGWDFVFSAPSIKKIRSELRAVSEGAYRHINKATIGLKGYYLEIYHLADDTGQAKSDVISDRIKRIRKQTFQLYQSTATGKVKDTDAGQNIFKQPKVIIFAALFVALLSVLVSAGNPLDRHFPGTEDQQTVEATATKPGPLEDAKTIAIQSGESGHQGGVSHAVFNTGTQVHPRSDYLADYDIFISGELFGEYFINIKNGKGINLNINGEELRRLGYRFERYSQCLWLLVINEEKRMITCQPEDNELGRGRLQVSENNINPFDNDQAAAQ